MFTKVSKSQDLKIFIERLNDFGNWLLSLTPGQFSLSSLAHRVCYSFGTEYCSIHIHREGKWHNLSGNFVNQFPLEIPDSLKSQQDREFGTLELAEEQALVVRNFPIRIRNESAGLLVVKSHLLSNESIQLIATMIALAMSTVENS